jgi:hypothetical protein
MVFRGINGSNSETNYVQVDFRNVGGNSTWRGDSAGTFHLHDNSATAVFKSYGYDYVPQEPANPTIRIKAYDIYNNQTIERFTINFNNGTNRSTTNGTVSTEVKAGVYYFNVSGIIDDTTGNYYPLNKIPYYDFINASTNGTTYTKLIYPYQSNIYFRTLKLMSNETLLNSSYYVNGTLAGIYNATYGTIQLPANTNYNLIIAPKNNYFNKSFLFNVSALDDKIVYATGVYDARVTFSPRDIINNNTINNANITIYNNTYSYTISGNNITNKTFNITTGKYLLTITAPKRNIYNQTIEVTSKGISNYYAYMYSYNSVWIYAKDQITGLTINNFSISVENSTHSYTNQSVSGLAIINLIPSGSYVVKVNANNYTQANYNIVVTDNSHQTLTTYLSSTVDNVLFVLRDKNTNAVIDGVLVTQKRSINGTLTTINSKLTDVAGLAQFPYSDDIIYTFIVSKNNYISRTFTLEPILSSYTVILTPITTTNESLFIDDVVFTVKGYSFKNNQTNYFAVDFYSGDGSLEYYKVFINSTYNDTVIEGTNANGGTINATTFITGVTPGGYAIVTIAYKSTYNNKELRKSYIYNIQGFTPSTASLETIKEGLGSLGKLELALIGTIICAFITGIFAISGAAMGASGLSASIGGLFSIALMSKIGFFPPAAILASVLILALIIVTRLNTDGT